MKNKKGVVQAGVVVVIIAILGLTAVGAGYMVYKKNVPSVEVGSDGVEVNADGVKVKTGANGVNVDMDGVNVDTTDGVNVDTDGVSVDINGGGVNVQTKGSATATEGGASIPDVNSVLIFDASGSMAAKVGGTPLIQLAKNAVADYVGSLEGDVNLSVVAYGHKGNNTQAGKQESCNGIEEIYYMGPVNASVVTSKVNALNPNGWTPIANSLQRAADILQKSGEANKKHIFLLSDGEETCGGDPVALACKLKESGIVVDVAGLNVTGAVAKQLEAISQCGGGEYFSVNNASDFSVVIDGMGVKVNTGDVFVDVSGDGTKVNTGNLDVDATSSGTKVDAGNVKVDTTTGGMPKVKVPSGTSIPSY